MKARPTSLIALILLSPPAALGWLASDSRIVAGLAAIQLPTSDVESKDWQLRRRAFASLIGIDEHQYLERGVRHIASVLAQTLTKDAATTEARKQSLIRLLEIENARVTREPKLSEEYVNYYGDVVAAVASLRDERSLNALLGAIKTGNMVRSALVDLGTVAVVPVSRQLQSSDALVRVSAAAILGQMLNRSVEISQDTNSIAKIKSALLQAALDRNPWVRMHASEGLARIGDAESIAVVEKLAQTDSYRADFGAHKGKYLVREAAKKALAARRKPGSA